MWGHIFITQCDGKLDSVSSLFLQPSIADILSLAWWTSTVAWWECVYCMSNDKETSWGCPLKTILTVFRLLIVKQMPLGYFQLSVTAAVTCCLFLCIHGHSVCFVLLTMCHVNTFRSVTQQLLYGLAYNSWLYQGGVLHLDTIFVCTHEYLWAHHLPLSG